MKKSVIILLALVLSFPMFAQGRFGKDSAECVKYLSYYTELVKQNNLAEAAPFWRQAFSLCPPTASQNMLIHGQRILRNEIGQNRKDPVRYRELVDTLLMLNDIRAKVYPKNAVKSLDNKAIDVVNYFGSDYETQYKYLTEILGQIKSEASPVVYVNQMKSAVEMYRNQKLDAEGVMNNYTMVAGLLDTKIDSSNDPEYRSAKQTVESLLIDSGVASCDNLVALYTPRFEANPNDEALLTNMVYMLSKSECMNTDLFLKAIVALNEINPTASSVYGLYRLYSSRDENTKAAETLERAISLLNAAELSLLLGQDGSSYLKQVRDRANCHDTGTSREDIIQERHKEFVGEGKRYWDLVRSGQAAFVLTAANHEYRTVNWTDNKKYWPIPQSEIDKDPALQQNNY